MVRHTLVLLIAALLAGCAPATPTPYEPIRQGDDDDSADEDWVTLQEGLQIRDIVLGDGAEVQSGDDITAHYALWLWEDDALGELIETSRGGSPFSATVGVGELISGWDIGIPGMRVGGVRELIIGPDLAYGSAGAGGSVPPDATLFFEVEVLALQ